MIWLNSTVVLIRPITTQPFRIRLLWLGALDISTSITALEPAGNWATM
jgi:hypothetical protein